MPCASETLLKDKHTTICCGWFSKFGFAAVFRAENEVGIDENISVGHKCQSAEFLMEHENMNRQKKYHSNGDGAVEDQDDGKMIQDYTKQTGSEGDHNQPKQ